MKQRQVLFLAKTERFKLALRRCRWLRPISTNGAWIGERDAAIGRPRTRTGAPFGLQRVTLMACRALFSCQRILSTRSLRRLATWNLS